MGTKVTLLQHAENAREKIGTFLTPFRKGHESYPFLSEKGKLSYPERGKKVTPQKKEKQSIGKPSKGGEDTRAKTGAREERRRRRIPLGWQPSEEDKTWARSQGFEPTIDLDVETQEFCEYWRNDQTEWAYKWNWTVVWKQRMRRQYSRALNQLKVYGPQRARPAKGFSPEQQAQFEATLREREEEERRAQQRRSSVYEGDGSDGRLSTGA
jgi:hypothetical protein